MKKRALEKKKLQSELKKKQKTKNKTGLDLLRLAVWFVIFKSYIRIESAPY